MPESVQPDLGSVYIQQIEQPYIVLKQMGAPAPMLRYARAHFDPRAPAALVAMLDHHKPIGVVFFESTSATSAYARGTYVVRAFRRKGVASLLWDELARLYPQSQLIVITNTRAGRAFVHARKKRHTQKIHHYHDYAP